MDERLRHLESRVEDLARALEAVEGRLGRLEAGGSGAGRPTGEERAAPARAAAAPADAAPAREQIDFVAGLSLVGRSLLCLAGAYLLRSFTRGELLPPSLGVAAALAYAALWLYFADRAGGRAKSVSAAFHGATAVLMAVPLVWETTTRFAILTAAASAAALAAVAALALYVAWRRNLTSLAWIVSLGAGTSALMLGGPTKEPMPYTVFLVLLGVATLWLARDRSWHGLPWLTAALADLAVLLLTTEDTIAEGYATAGGVVAIQLALFVLYAASFALAARRRVTGLAVLQTALAVAVGYAGAFAVLRDLPGAAAVFGGASLLLAAGLYGVGLLVIDRREKAAALFFSTLAIPLVLAASLLLLGRPAYLWALLALAGAALGSYFSRFTLSFHAAVYALAAAVASGLLSQAARAWVGSAASEQSATTPEGLLALAALAVCVTFPVRGDMAFWRRFAPVPRLVFLVLAAGATGGLLVRLGAALFAAGGDPGAVATVRTAVLAAAALALAGLAWLERPPEASVLVYPVLILGAVKLLIEDLPGGRPETLFLALAAYGVALIVAPRLRRRRAAPTGGPSLP